MKNMPKDRFVLLQASEFSKPNRVRLSGESRDSILNAKLAIELAKRFDNNPEILSKDQLEILENYLTEELGKVNPNMPQEGFEFVYQNSIHFYLRLRNYDKVIELYKKLQKLINENDLDINMDCAILATIAFIKLNKLDIARRTYNYIRNYFENQGLEHRNSTEILFQELFKEHNIDIKKVLGN